MPRADPWHPPTLHPDRRNTGITSSLKLTGRSTAAFATLTGTFTDWPAAVTVISVAPSATGSTTFLSSLTRAGLANVTFAWSVTSRVMPSGCVSWTTKLCRSRLVSRLTSGG